MEINGLKIELTPLVFVDHLPPEGFLSREMACHALWYYYIIALSARRVVGKSIDDQTIEYDAESSAAPPLWMDKRYNAQYESVAILYGVSPQEMKAYWPNVKLEINRLGLTPVPSEIENLTGYDWIT